MSHVAEPWVLLEGKPLLSGSVGKCQRAVCLKEGGSGVHVPMGGSAQACISCPEPASDCLRLSCAGLCFLLAPGCDFLGLWKPPGGRTQPFPSGISPLDLHSDLGATPGTATAWLLAGTASWASSTLGSW